MDEKLQESPKIFDLLLEFKATETVVTIETLSSMLCLEGAL